MNFLRKAKILFLALLVASSISVGYTAMAVADAKSDVCAGVNLTGSSGCGGGGAQVSSIIKATINILSLIAGVVAVVMIIVGGLKYITSGGESSNISSAKNTIIYALVGLVIVALAQVIVHFVLGKV